MPVFIRIWYDFCITPVYLADVRAQEKDQATWLLLANGSFSVNINTIGAFHEIEQENRSLKVLGVIKVIANSTQVLAEYFLTAAEMGNIIEFLWNIWNWRDEHHQLFGSKNKRSLNNVDKMPSVYDNYNFYIWLNNCVYNTLTKTVLSEKEAHRFLVIKKIGHTRYEQFVTEILEDKGSIWDTIKKEKLSPSASNNKTKM